MNVSRRDFLKKTGLSASALALGCGRADASEAVEVSDDWMGVLVDLPKCIGCRQCEAACLEANGFEVPREGELHDPSIFTEYRRPGPDTYTVVNRFHQVLFSLPVDLEQDLNGAESAISERLCREFAEHGIALADEGIVSVEERGVRWRIVAAEESYAVKKENGELNVHREPSPINVKINCFHCNDPACVSACLVGAFEKLENGAVVYDAWKCMGCRYCLVACPFGIPTYEYGNALTPQVRKCTFCSNEGNPNKGGIPACVRVCPKECLTYGKRSELLIAARQQIRQYPDEYVDHIYGEHEAGGTSWLYLSAVPFEQLGFLTLGAEAPPRLTEAIQHSVFKHWMPPVAWFGLLGVIMYLSTPEQRPDTKAMDERGSAEQHHEDTEATVV